jgi:Carboxypeptidase regulatory-like domain
VKQLAKPLAICLLLGIFGFSQEFRATVTGRVTDPSGAPVPGVAIQIKNIDTNEQATSTSDSSGAYTIPFLRPGNYTMTVESAGFKKLIRDGITLQVSQTAAIDSPECSQPIYAVSTRCRCEL